MLYNSILQQGKKQIKRDFGFIPDPSLSVHENVKKRLLSMSPQEFFNHVPNRSCHNLCTNTHVLPAVIKLLGLGLKFCVNDRPPTPDLNSTMNRFRTDVRRTYQFLDAEDNDDDGEIRYHPKLYVRNQEWTPDPASPEIEAALDAFAQSVQSATQRHQAQVHNQPNLLKFELRLLNELRQNKDLIVLMTDKNLGPAIWERTAYIKQILSEHLLKTDRYKQLTKEEAKAHQEATRKTICQHYKKYKDKLAKHEWTFYKRSMDPAHNDFRTPQFYGMPKVHKEELQTRPVVSCVGSIPQILSQHLHFHLDQVVHLCPSYLKNSWELIEDLRKLGPLPPGSRMFTADAVGMYNNIDATHAIEIIGKWLDLHAHELPRGFPPKDFILEGLNIVMTTNVFQFGDTFWLQLNGTAMGTSVACTYATIYYSYHEETRILDPTVDHGILFYRRYIDDGYCIQNPTPGAYARLVQDLNNFGKEDSRLQWKATKLASQDVVFLDLTLPI